LVAFSKAVEPGNINQYEIGGLAYLPRGIYICEVNTGIEKYVMRLVK
jgi:hypothetical protein